MALSELAVQSFAPIRQAYDARADHHRRTVHVSLTGVAIERRLAGMRMWINVPMEHYRAVRIAVAAPGRSATVTLTHSDPDLAVELALGATEEAALVARAWASVLEKPIVVEAGATIAAAYPRAVKTARPSRRSAFARRRKAGRPALTGVRFSGEREIIART